MTSFKPIMRTSRSTVRSMMVWYCSGPFLDAFFQVRWHFRQPLVQLGAFDGDGGLVGKSCDGGYIGLGQGGADDGQTGPITPR